MFCILLPFLKQNWRELVHEKLAEKGNISLRIGSRGQIQQWNGFGKVMLISLILPLWSGELWEKTAGDVPIPGTDGSLFYSSRLGISLDCDACSALSFVPGPTCLCWWPCICLLSMSCSSCALQATYEQEKQPFLEPPPSALWGPAFPIDRVALHPAAFFFQISP